MYHLSRKKYVGFFVLILWAIPFMHLLSLDKIRNDFFRSYLSVEDGLSQSEVTSIVQDKYGFIWLGTRGGLNRYDGYSFEKYMPKRGMVNGLQNPSIETLMADSKGNIWIGSKSGGATIYDVSKSEFIVPDSLKGKLPNRIVKFFEDRDGNIWIATWADGLYKYNPESFKLDRFLINIRVSSITQTDDGAIWVGTNTGLRCLKPGANAFNIVSIGDGYKEVTEMVESESDSCLWLAGWNVGLIKLNYINFTYSQHQLSPELDITESTYSLLLDTNKDVWVGTWGKGVYCFDTATEMGRKIPLIPLNTLRKSTDYDIILDIFQDSVGDIWIGTDGGGVVKLSSNIKFHTALASNDSLAHMWHVNSVYKNDKNDKDELWMGTRSNGLFVTSDNEKFEMIGFAPGRPDKKTIPFAVNAIYLDSAHHVWVGCNSGLFIVSESRRGKRFLLPAFEFLNSPSLNAAKKIQDIKEFFGEIWVATQQNGLYVFYEQKGLYKLKKHFYSGSPNNILQDNRVSSLTMDKEGAVWIGSYKGLYRYEKSDTFPLNINKLIVGNKELPCDIVLSCRVDNLNRVWIGTPCGLYGLVPTKDGQYQLYEYSSENGLSNDYINAIEFTQDLIWVSTNFGISSVDPLSGDIRNYDVSDGVGGYNFVENASFKSKDGMLYFGGNTDLTYFNPDALKDDPKIPPIVFTNFKILNQEVFAGEKSVLSASINQTEAITLNHQQKEFSFEIAALNFTSSKNNQYSYRLISERDSGDWIFIGTRRHISFSNLRPGDYVLQVAGSNSNGVWNREGRSLKITILPPFWKTWYAFVLYLLVLLIIVILINRVTVYQHSLKSQVKVEHIKRVQENEMNESKLKFFTDITHEIKTPLSLIQGPVEELMDCDFQRIDQSFFKHRIELIFKSSSRLMSLLNQLLEFRKVEADKVQLKASENNIVDFVEDMCAAYKSLAIRKEISFKVNIQVTDKLLWFDRSKMEMILSNLLSNAFKYCGNPGAVTINLSESEHEIIIEVVNNGRHISENEIEKLFDRFYQAAGANNQGGSGIGLFLVKNFVDLHKGRLSVISNPDNYTCFRLAFLKASEHLSDEQKVAEEAVPFIKKQQTHSEKSGLLATKNLPANLMGSKLLIVDDNDDVRDYLISLLQVHFNVIEARDGLSGFEAVLEHKPDLVISDVMMPKSDGYEFCARIKSNSQTLDIPVILLTGKGKREDHLMGTRKGADAYITKPFDPALLYEKIRQLITTRAALLDKYKKRVSLDPLNKEIVPEDEVFLKRVISIIEKEMANASLDAEFVASEIGMSASTFYRKMKNVVEQSPGEFVKSIRMKKAAKYLSSTNLTVSEIVERVGYSDLRNFRNSFKSQFGSSPVDYRKNSKDTVDLP